MGAAAPNPPSPTPICCWAITIRAFSSAVAWPWTAPRQRLALARVGGKVGLDAVGTACGIHRLVTENMAAAARIHIVEKGKDPRRYAMVGFGGAGPAHVAEVARVLGRAGSADPAGLGCCVGAGLPRRAAVVRASAQPSGEAGCRGGAKVIDAALRDLEQETRAHLIAAGVAAGDVVVERSADMRLEGPDAQINVPLPDGPITDGNAAGDPCRLRHRLCGALHVGLCAASAVQAISFRVRCRGPLPAAVAHRGRRARVRLGA